MKVGFGTLGHYVINTASGANAAVVAWLVERDPEGMSVAEIDAKLERLTELSTEVSKAHSKFDAGKSAYDDAVAKNAVSLRAAENMQKKIDDTPPGPDRDRKAASLKAYLDKVESDQAELDSLKQVAASAKGFYDYMQNLFDEKGNRLKKMKAELSIAGNAMKIARNRADEAMSRQKVVESVAGGSASNYKFDVALNAMKKSVQSANEQAEASERMVNKLTEDSSHKDEFVAKAVAEASGQTAPPTATADRIAALKSKAA